MYIILFTEDILMALLCAADTGVYGLTGEAVAPLVSGGAPDVLEVAKFTQNFDGSASEVAPGAVGTPSSSVLSPLGTVDSIACINCCITNSDTSKRTKQLAHLGAKVTIIGATTPYPLLFNGVEGVEGSRDGRAGSLSVCRHDLGR